MTFSLSRVGGPLVLALIPSLFVLSCEETPVPKGPVRAPSVSSPDLAGPVFVKTKPDPASGDGQQSALILDLVQKFGAAQRPRIERGVKQVAALWRSDDGDLAAFVREHFLADEKQLAALVQRMQVVFEQIDGHNGEIQRELRRTLEHLRQ